MGANLVGDVRPSVGEYTLEMILTVVSVFGFRA